MAIDIGMLLAAATAIVSIIGWYRSQIRTSYAQEREYTHIVRYLEQAAISHQELFKELDKLSERMSRLEILMIKEAK